MSKVAPREVVDSAAERAAVGSHNEPPLAELSFRVVVTESSFARTSSTEEGMA
jgi:hypothetical protein